MKKLTVLFTALFSLAVIFTSCEKEDPKDDTQFDPSKIEAKVVDGSNYNSKVDSVFLQIYSYEAKSYIALGKSKYTNGGFSMKLDAVQSSLLYPITEIFYNEGITISDKTAKSLYIYGDPGKIFTARKNNEKVGFFVCSNVIAKDAINNEEGLPVGGGIVFYIYTDKAVTITGTVTEEDSGYTTKEHYDLSLKAGWNTLALKCKSQSKESIEYEYTTKENLANYKWYLLGFED